MGWKQKKQLSILLMAGFLLLAACGSNEGKNMSTDTPSTGNNSAAPQASATPQAVVEPLGKYEPAVTITTVRLDDGVTKFLSGEGWDNNIWYKAYEEELGIKVKNQWIAPAAGNQFTGKMNVSIASGDLPDMFQVDGSQLEQLADAGLIMDLSEIYNKYATPMVKEMLALDQGIGISSATMNGKLMAVPMLASYSDYVGDVWVRTDWLKKYNLPEPKTMDDVWTIAETFKKESTGGKGTVGLPLIKEIIVKNNLGGADQIFNGYHAYPGIWIKDASEKLVYGSVQPAMKTVLAKLQEEYKNGVIDREFGVKDQKKVCELLVSGKAGIYFGGMADPLACTQASYDKDGALWKPLPIVSVDQSPAKSAVSVSPTGFYVVKKDAEHPEALFKMLNLFVEKHEDSASEKIYFQAQQTGDTQPFHYAPFQVWRINENVEIHRVYMKKAKGDDISSAKDSYKDIVSKIEAYLNGDGKEWAWDAIFGAASTQQVINDYLENDLYMFNAYTGPGTPAMKEKNALLSKMESEMMTRIIMGSSPIDDFDKFVSDWKKLGGDDITKEVNDWYATHK